MTQLYLGTGRYLGENKNFPFEMTGHESSCPEAVLKNSDLVDLVHLIIEFYGGLPGQNFIRKFLFYLS